VIIAEMDEWDQIHDLPTRTVLAVLAPDDTFWLAETCATLKPTQMRIAIKWLQERSTTTRRSPLHRLFSVDSTWDPAFIWRDSVLADLSSSAILDENDVWSIPRQVLETIQTQAKKCNEPSSLQQTTTVQPVSASDTLSVCETTFELVKQRCTSALIQVQKKFHKYFNLRLFQTLSEISYFPHFIFLNICRFENVAAALLQLFGHEY
jgi:hypothetical protein